jgi:hypothetical protein
MVNLFRIFHVFFASMTLALLPVMMILRRKIAMSKGTPAELTTMGTMLWIGRLMGMVGGLGLLLTGGALTGIETYKWFSFSEFPWLAWKQTIFVVILIINFAFMMPSSKKMEALMNKQEASGGLATDEIRALGAKLGMFGMIMNLLALAAMTLGVSKGIF